MWKPFVYYHGNKRFFMAFREISHWERSHCGRRKVDFCVSTVDLDKQSVSEGTEKMPENTVTNGTKEIVVDIS